MVKALALCCPRLGESWFPHAAIKPTSLTPTCPWRGRCCGAGSPALSWSPRRTAAAAGRQAGA